MTLSSFQKSKGRFKVQRLKWIMFLIKINLSKKHKNNPTQKLKHTTQSNLYKWSEWIFIPNQSSSRSEHQRVGNDNEDFAPLYMKSLPILAMSQTQTFLISNPNNSDEEQRREGIKTVFVNTQRDQTCEEE